MFILMLCFAIGSRYTCSGRRGWGAILARVGSNIEAARRVGINVTKVTVVVPAFGGLRDGGGHAAGGAVDDGQSDRGIWRGIAGDRGGSCGRRKFVRRARHGGGLLIGSVLFTTIGNGANLLGVNSFWQMVIEGLLIAGVVYLDNVQKRRASGG